MAFQQQPFYGGAASYGGFGASAGGFGDGSFVQGGSFLAQDTYGGGFQQTMQPAGFQQGGIVRDAGAVVAGYEHVRLRVPAKQQVRTVFVPGPVLNRTVQAPPREVVRTVRVQGPEQIQKVSVQGPAREVVRRVAVQGPERVVTRQVSVQGPPREVVRRVAVQGPSREVIKRVEVQGPPREVVKRVEVQGPAREQIQTVEVKVPGPAREVVRKVAVPRDIVRQVVKHVNVDQIVDQPVPVQGPGAVHVRFLVDGPPQIVPVPQPVFRTQLVPTVVLVPHTSVGIVPVPQAIPTPPQMMNGPVVPEQAFHQHFGAQQVGPAAAATFGGYGGPQVGAQNFGTFGGGFGAPAFEQFGAPQFGAPQFAAPSFGAPVVDQGFNQSVVVDQGAYGGSQVIQDPAYNGGNVIYQ